MTLYTSNYDGFMTTTIYHLLARDLSTNEGGKLKNNDNADEQELTLSILKINTEDLR